MSKDIKSERQTIASILIEPDLLNVLMDNPEIDETCFTDDYSLKAYKWMKGRYESKEPVTATQFQLNSDLDGEIFVNAGPVNSLDYEDLLKYLIKLKNKRRKIKTAAEVSRQIMEEAPQEEIQATIKQLKTNKNEEWPDPIPLNEINIEQLPVNVLSDWLRDFVITLSGFTQTPQSMASLLSLSAVAAALSNKAVIEVRPGYTEPLILWTCSVLPPANRKSAVFKKIINPILDYESEKTQEIAPERRRAIKEKEILEGQQQKLEKEAINAKDNNKRSLLMDRINNIGDEIEELKIPSIPRLVVDNATNERLTQLMSENHGRAFIASPEGGVFLIMAGQYSGYANLDIYKKGWTGSEPIRDDRMSREGTYVREPALSMGLTVQPVVFEDLKAKRAFTGEGVVGRFLYLQPESPIGNRKTGNNVPELNEKAVNNYNRAMQVLLNSQPKGIDENGDFEPFTIKLSNEARKIHNDFEAEVEVMLREDGELSGLPDWGGKLVGNVTRIAGLLHIADQINAETGQAIDLFNRPVSGSAMERAVKLGHTLIGHAQKVYNLLDLDPEIELAKYILERIIRGHEMERNGVLKKTYKKDKLDKAVLYQLTTDKKEIKSPDDLNQPLKLLEELNYIKVIKIKKNGPGRPPAPIIKLNPRVDLINLINPINYNKKGLLGKLGTSPSLKNDNDDDLDLYHGVI